MRLFLLIVVIGILNKDSNGYSNHLKFSLRKFPLQIKSVPCPDGESSCPDSETCCRLESGEYGCCPLPEAVCCSDHLHCCPNGYQCDVEHSRCQKGFERSDDVLCPGGEMSCTDGETCCQLESGDYGCCPLPDAVCCSDDSHCCPNGYQCDIKENKCQKGILIPWFRKKVATPLDIPSKLIVSHSFSSSFSTIRCPDEKSICPEETTCCELTNGTYGCCPYNQASCCSDKIHCCGEGYSCDQSGSRCIRHLSLIPLSIIEEQICPDGKSKCSLSSTCCPNVDDGSYSCCPYSRGVCCGSNGSSCCPYKYICDEEKLSCQLNETMWKSNQMFNQCGKSNVVCRDDERCCQMSERNVDEYGCCAFPEGVCCEDGKHCCPKDHQCDLKSGGCISK